MVRGNPKSVTPIPRMPFVGDIAMSTDRNHSFEEPITERGKRRKNKK